jgi:predicted transcriptional regulator
MTEDNVRGALRREILAYVRKHPACTTEDLSAALDRPISGLGDAMLGLVEQGLLGRQRDGRSYRYFRPDRNFADMRDDTLIEANREVEFSSEVIEEMEADLIEMARAIEALERWKADAIAKHRDLAPVDPDLLRAREIAAAAMGDEAACDIRGGDADHSPLVQAVLTALKAG